MLIINSIKYFYIYYSEIFSSNVFIRNIFPRIFFYIFLLQTCAFSNFLSYKLAHNWYVNDPHCFRQVINDINILFIYLLCQCYFLVHLTCELGPHIINNENDYSYYFIGY